MTCHQEASLVKTALVYLRFSSPDLPLTGSQLFNSLCYSPPLLWAALSSSWSQGVSVQLDKSVLLASLARLPIFLLFRGRRSFWPFYWNISAERLAATDSARWFTENREIACIPPAPLLLFASSFGCRPSTAFPHSKKRIRTRRFIPPCRTPGQRPLTHSLFTSCQFKCCQAFLVLAVPLHFLRNTLFLVAVDSLFSKQEHFRSLPTLTFIPLSSPRIS